MERFQGKLLVGDQLLVDQVEGSIAIQEPHGTPEWRGRFWLPSSSPVQSGGRLCLIPDDGQPRGAGPRGRRAGCR